MKFCSHFKKRIIFSKLGGKTRFSYYWFLVLIFKRSTVLYCFFDHSTNIPT